MKEKRYILALLICILFLTSCVSPLKKSLVNEEMPKFVGSITPITIPIQPEYQPVNQSMKLNISLATDVFFTFNTGSGKYNHSIHETEISMNAILNVKKLGDMLTWNMKVIEYTENNNSHKTNIPIADVTILTDKYGDIKESEILLPFFEQPQIRSKMGETEVEDIKKEMKEALNFSGVLPKTPVITGNDFMKGRFIEALSKDLFVLELFGGKMPEEPASILKGWGYFEGKKVLVSVTDFVVEKKIAEHNATVSIIIKGYALTDPENFMSVQGEGFLKAGIFGIPRKDVEKLWRALEINGEIPTYPFTSADMTMRIRVTMSSKLKN